MVTKVSEQPTHFSVRTKLHIAAGVGQTSARRFPSTPRVTRRCLFQNRFPDVKVRYASAKGLLCPATSGVGVEVVRRPSGALSRQSGDRPARFRPENNQTSIVRDFVLV